MLSYFMLVEGIFLVIVSFFVLLGVSKTDSKKLAAFGRMITLTLWLLAVCSVVGALFYSISENKYGKYEIKPRKKINRLLKSKIPCEPMNKY